MQEVSRGLLSGMRRVRGPSPSSTTPERGPTLDYGPPARPRRARASSGPARRRTADGASPGPSFAFVSPIGCASLASERERSGVDRDDTRSSAGCDLLLHGSERMRGRCPAVVRGAPAANDPPAARWIGLRRRHQACAPAGSPAAPSGSCSPAEEPAGFAHIGVLEELVGVGHHDRPRRRLQHGRLRRRDVRDGAGSGRDARPLPGGVRASKPSQRLHGPVRVARARPAGESDADAHVRLRARSRRFRATTSA